MSVFEPNTRVRCIDCSNYSNGACSVKSRTPKTAPRKRRTCAKYSFSGFINNRTSPPSEFRPFWWWYSKKEKKILSRLAALGVSPSTGVAEPAMPKSTAASSVLKPTTSDDPLLVQVGDSNEDRGGRG